MASKLAELVVQMSADSVQLRRDMAQVQRSTKNLEKGFARTGQVLRQTFVGVVSITAVSKAFQTVVAATVESEAAMRQLEARIKSTGGAAGLTAKQIADSAKQFQQVSIFDDEAILKSQALLLTFTRVTGETFDSATQAVLDMSIAMEQDLQSSTVQIGKALNDPIKGLTALSRVGVAFTEQQKEQIKQMVAVGDVAGAQKVILAELAVEFGGAAKAARDTLGGALQSLQNTMGDLLENDSSSLSALTKAVNGLNEALGDPKVKQSIDQLTSSLVDGLTWVVEKGPTIADNLDTIASAVVNLGKAFIVFKAASFGAARGGPIGAALLGTATAMELFKGEIGKFFASPEMKRLMELSEQSPADKAAALKAALGPVANPSGLVVTIGGPDNKKEGAGRASPRADLPVANPIADVVDTKAFDQLSQMQQSLREQVATFGMAETAALKYRLTQGDLAAVVKEAGAQGQVLAASLVQLSGEYERVQASADEAAASIALDEALRDQLQSMTESLATQEEALRDSYARRELIVEQSLDRGLISEARYLEIIGKLQAKEAEALKELIDGNQTELSKFVETAAENLQNVMADTFFNFMQGKFDDLGGQFKQMLDRMVANALAAKLGDVLFGAGFGKSTSDIGGLIGKVFGAFGGKREHGGPVTAGQPYIVGERRAELFVPDSNGHILPSVPGGGSVVNIYQTFTGVQDARGVRESGTNVAARTGAAVNAALARNR